MFGRKYINEKERERNTEKKFYGFPIVEHYKFLGVTLAPNFSVRYHLENIKKKNRYISLRILTIPKRCMTPYHFILLWTILLRSNCFYGILLVSFLKRKKLEKESWLTMIRTSLKKLLRIENAPLEFTQFLLSNKEVEEEGEYRRKIAEEKWRKYRENNGENRRIIEHEEKAEKPNEYHLNVIKKLKNVPWEFLTLANISKFNLKKCGQCQDAYLVLEHIQKVHGTGSNLDVKISILR